MTGAADSPPIQPTGRGNAFEDVFDEMTAPKVRPGAGAPAEPKPAGEAAAAPAQRKAAAPRKRAGKAAGPAKPAKRAAPRAAAPAGVRTDLPQHVTRAEATTPLQVKIPVTLHWQLKQAAAWAARSGGMTRAVTALVTLYTHDPELIDRLIDEAESDGQTLGEWLHDALLALTGEQRE